MSLLSLLRKDTGRYTLKHGPSKGKTLRIKRLTVLQAEAIKIAFQPIAADLNGAEKQEIHRERAVDLVLCLAHAIDQKFEWTVMNVVREDYDAVWAKLMEAERDFFGGLVMDARPTKTKPLTPKANATAGPVTSSS